MTTNQKYWINSIQKKLDKGAKAQTIVEELIAKYEAVGKDNEIRDIKVACLELGLEVSTKEIVKEEEPIKERIVIPKEELNQEILSLVTFCNTFNIAGNLEFDFDFEMTVEAFKRKAGCHKKSYDYYMSKLEELRVEDFTSVKNVHPDLRLDPSADYKEGRIWIRPGESGQQLDIFSWHNVKQVHESFYSKKTGFGPFNNVEDSFFAYMSWGKLGEESGLQNTAFRSKNFESFKANLKSYLNEKFGLLFKSLINVYKEELYNNSYLD